MRALSNAIIGMMMVFSQLTAHSGGGWVMSSLREYLRAACASKHSPSKTPVETTASRGLRIARQQDREETNFRGFVQEAELKLILAGKWPPLKPLPVFKYGTDEYRAEIYFDRTRGEWVCRKTSLPSNEVQELRGGLKEITMALPHGEAEGLTEAVTAEQHEKESENEANRRVQAILDWKKNYENGVLYSELQDYLSESQQNEIHDCIRMSLTAWQLQLNPKNIAFVFDALCNAGGRLATLIEIAKRNRAEREPDAQGQTEKPTLEAEDQVSLEAINHAHHQNDQRLQTRTPVPVDEIQPKQGPVPIRASPPADSGVTVLASTAEISIDDVPQSQEAAFTPGRLKDSAPGPIKTFAHQPSEGLTPESVESVLPTTLELFPIEPDGSLSLVQPQTSSSEPVVDAATRASQVGAHRTLGASAPSRVAALLENAQYHTAVAGLGPQVRTDDAKSSADPTDGPSSAVYASGISAKRGFGFRIGALVLLATGFTIGFTVGLNTPPIPPETEESQNQSGQSPKARPDDSAARVTPTGPASSAKGRSDLSGYLDGSSRANKLDGPMPFGRQPTESTSDPVSLAKVPSADSSPSPPMESKPSANAEADTELNASTGLIARNAPLLSRSEPAQSLDAVDQMRGEPRHPALRSAALATLRPSPRSTILVTAPAEGSRSLTLTFPEKPVAVSSSFAITSQLSVLISPEPGPAVAHKPARLQAGELVSYVWPHYPRPRDRHGSSETVKVRATIGRHGEIFDVKRVSGSISLLPDAVGAIRLWRYNPTLLNKRPINAQVDVTIEFRPSQY